MKKYNHAMDIAFEVLSDSETDPTREEIFEGLEKRITWLKLHPQDVKEAAGIFDTMEN